MEIWKLILIHQFIFQGMFVLKNVILSRKLDKKIRGHNFEANISIAFFVLFIGIALIISCFNQTVGAVRLFGSTAAMTIGLVLLSLNIVVSGVSLISLKDSWRVGVIEEQKTELISTGIYRYTRNPYFLSYLLMFASYTVLLQNLVLLFLSIIGFFLIHKMILKEEEYLYSVHGDSFIRYKESTPRYLIK